MMVSFRSLLLGFTLVATSSVTACSGVDPEETLQISCPLPDEASFRDVSLVVERRCGTLDCHGNPERPMRVYGQWAVRKPLDQAPGANYVPGGDDTTPEELTDNARTICGLEPLKTARVRAYQENIDTLTFIRKPRLQEKHKGGRIWDIASDGDKCMTSWILATSADQVDHVACANEAKSHL